MNVLAFAHHSLDFVTGSDDGTIRLWDTESGALEKEVS